MPYQLLFADDSATMHRVVQITFAREDFAIISVNNGPAAIAKAKEIKPDVAVIDISMPGMDGYAVCQSLKSDPATAQIPVLLLAGSQEPFDEGKAQASGANGHVVKPFETQALVDKVKTLVGAPITSATAPRAGGATAAPPTAQVAKPPNLSALATAPVTKPAAPPTSGAPMPPASGAPAPPPAWAPPAAGAPPRPPVVAAPVAPVPMAAPVSRPVVAADDPFAAAITAKPAFSPPPTLPVAAPVVASPPMVAKPIVAAAVATPPPMRPPMGNAISDVANAAAQAVAQSTSAALGAAGLGSQVDQAALMTLAREIIERIAWEVVPALAETLLREQMDRLAKN